MAAPKKAVNRQIRQDSLREQLSGQKHIEQVIKNIIKIEGLAVADKGGDEIDYKDLQLKQFELKKLQVANEQRLKLVNKYLPDLKNTEIVGDGGSELTVKVTRKRFDGTD